MSQVQVPPYCGCSMFLTLVPNTVSPNSTVTAEAIISCESFKPSGTVTFSIAPYGATRPTPIPMEAIIAPPSPSPSPIYYQNVLCKTNVAGAGYTATASCTFRAPSEPGNYVVTATYMGVGGTLTSSSMLTVAWPSSPTTTTSTTSTQPTAPATKSLFGTLALPIALAGVLGVIVVAAAHSAKKG